jgi:PAS domain S-box-containing protein
LPAHECSRGSDRPDAPIPVAADRPIVAADFFEEAPCGYIVLATNGSFLQANQAFHDLTGLPRSWLQEHRFQDLLSRAGCVFYETQFAQVILLRETLSEVAFDLIGSNRNQIPVLVNAHLRRDAAGTPCDIFMTIFSASQRRAYEEDLLNARKSAEQMVEAIRHSSDAILTLSPSGQIQTWNHGALQMFGYTPIEAKGHSFFQLLFEGSSGNQVREAAALLARSRGVSREIPGVHKDGHRIELSVNLTPHMEAPGILVAFSAIIRDVSVQKAAERALIQSEKLASVGRLASSIAHEINNPLESVTNLLYLAQKTATNPLTREYLDTAERELRRASAITAQTLRFHKQSTNAISIMCQELFASVLSIYQGRLINSRVAVERRERAISPVVCFDGEIRQVLTNLISNAIDALHTGGGRLLLRSREATNWKTGRRGVCLTVADTGAGMSSVTKARAFEPFFTTKDIGGTGLGLWVSQQIVARHSGILAVRSSQNQVHTGTVFTLFLPFDAIVH